MGLKEGEWIYWHNNGKIKEEGAYQNNLKTGAWISRYDNGQKSNEGNYIEGKKRWKNGYCIKRKRHRKSFEL